MEKKSMKKYVLKSNSEEWKAFFLLHISNAETTMKEKEWVLQKIESM